MSTGLLPLRNRYHADVMPRSPQSPMGGTWGVVVYPGAGIDRLLGALAHLRVSEAKRHPVSSE